MKRWTVLFFLTAYMATMTAQLHLSSMIQKLLSRQLTKEHVSATIQGKKPSQQRIRQVCAFVDITGDAHEVLNCHGCQMLALQNTVAIAMIPLQKLPELAADRAVKRIEASPSASLTMDTMRLVVDALPVYEGQALPQAYTGRGVVMGIQDIGFDLTHPTFLSTDGSSCRIRRFWDQLSRDTANSTLPVGRDYSLPEDTIHHSTDALTETHGTHTAGIAAGSGFNGASLSHYRGMAPDADFCLVSNAVSSDTIYIDKADYYKYTTATDALGFQYIYDYADSVGQPCVISFSEGYQPYLDEEDILYKQFLESMLGPGHIFVTSAGNESVKQNYLPKQQGRLAVGSFLPFIDNRAVFLMRTTGTVHFRLDIIDLQSGALAASRIIFPDSLTTDSLPIGNDQLRWDVMKYASTAIDGDSICYAELTTYDGFAKHFGIALILEDEDEEMEAWTRIASFENKLNWQDATTGRNILCPGSFGRAITVGSTVHRTGFTNYEGQYRDYSNNGSGGRRSRYSSTGPSVEGDIKPDVCAPGDNVISAYSSFYIENNPEANDIKSDVEHFTFDGRTYAWNANTGTSMASPVVGGAIALWLEAKPDLTPEDVIDILAHTSRKPENTLTYPNNDYGYGEIDVYRGLLYLLGIEGLAGISSHQPEKVKIKVLQDHRLHISADNGKPSNGTLRLFNQQGLLMMTKHIEPSSQPSVVPLPHLPAGVYVVQFDSTDPAQTGSILIRL